jgi:hypothetical protein
MVNSTATFDVSWEMARKKGEKFPMTSAIKEFSFLNRWFIFKRKRQESMAAATVAEEASRPTSESPSSGTSARAAATVPRGRAENLAANARAVGMAATTVQREAAAAAANLRNERTVQVARAIASATPEMAAQNATVEVAPGPAAAGERAYTKGEVFLFYGKAALNDDQLRMKDPGAGRWLAPSARFPIEDLETKAIYPTVDHYIAGMRIKLATDKPELAETLFGREGSIHQKFLADRLSLTNAGTKPLSEEEDARLLEAEVAAVRDAMREPFLKRYWRGASGKIVDEAKWARSDL